MRKFVRLCLGFFLCCGVGIAQSTVVSVVVADSSSQVWANGTVSYVLIPRPGWGGAYTWNGATLSASYFTPTMVQLDDTGAGTWTIPTTSAISPVGTNWQYVFCPNATAPCTTMQIPAVGSTQDISSIVTAGLGTVQINAQNLPRAYADGEVATTVQEGGIYYNVTAQEAKVWDGAEWVAIGSGGGGNVPNPLAAHIVCFAGPTGGAPAPPVCRQLVQADIGADNAITGFSGGGPVEIGATVTNPGFTASYNFSPSGAQITNTDGIDSPLVLSTPYTSGTVVGSFVHTSTAVTTFTLTATGSTNSATTNINWLPLSFAGSGGVGATSATASGSTAVLNASAGTLPNVGLNNNCGGDGCSITTSGLQTIYLLLAQSGLTFHDCNTGFAMPFNSTPVTFTNQFGASISYTLYSTSGQLEGNYAPCS